MVNLSRNFRPTNDHIRFLNKGLSFVPTPKVNWGLKKQLQFDLQAYHRRLLLTSFFKYKAASEPLPFTQKSDWTPKLSQVPNQIRKIIRADKYAIKTLPWDYSQSPNLTPAEKRAIKELQHNNNVVLKPADKGSAVVIMDRIAYVGEAYCQLNQSQYYKRLNESLASKTGPKVLKSCIHLRRRATLIESN